MLSLYTPVRKFHSQNPEHIVDNLTGRFVGDQHDIPAFLPDGGISDVQTGTGFAGFHKSVDDDNIFVLNRRREVMGFAFGDSGSISGF